MFDDRMSEELEWVQLDKGDPNVAKGYFPQKRGKTGRRKAWTYIIGSKTDLPNLVEFCKKVPRLEVFGFRQGQEDGKLKNSYYI